MTDPTVDYGACLARKRQVRTGCPVVEEWARWTLSHPLRTSPGVCGQMTADQRKRVRDGMRRRKQNAHTRVNA